MRKSLQGFAQAHVIAQDAADFQFTQGLHPVQAFELVAAKFGVQPLGGGHMGMGGVLQAFGKVAQALTALPDQGNTIQIARSEVPSGSRK